MAGSITKHKNGWRVWASAGVDPDTGKRVRVSEVVTGAKRDAQRRLRELQTAVDRGEHVSKNAEPLSEFVARWWPSKKASVAHTTSVTYWKLLDRSILPVLGDTPIQRINSRHIVSFLADYIDRNKISQAEHLWVFLRLMFNAARDIGAIGHDPMRGVERPRPQKPEMRSITPEEWSRIRFALVENGGDGLAILTTLITTGMRRSELCGLEWRDVDFERSVLHVRRTFHHVGGVSTYGEPKTQRSRRAIALDPGTLDLLAGVRSKVDQLARLSGRKLSESSPVFTVDGSRPYSPDSITGMWQRISRKVGVKAKLHDLRHTAATLMLAAGVPVGDVSDRLGHSSPGFTLDVYRHSVPGAQEEAAAKLAAALSVGIEKPTSIEM